MLHLQYQYIPLFILILVIQREPRPESRVPSPEISAARWGVGAETKTILRCVDIWTKTINVWIAAVPVGYAVAKILDDTP